MAYMERWLTILSERRNIYLFVEVFIVVETGVDVDNLKEIESLSVSDKEKWCMSDYVIICRNVDLTSDSEVNYG